DSGGPRGRHAEVLRAAGDKSDVRTGPRTGGSMADTGVLLQQGNESTGSVHRGDPGSWANGQ
ncbi:MAG: hypothetical protein ACK55Z_25630, partial [bacterium]